MPGAFTDTHRHLFPHCFWLIHSIFYNLCDIISSVQPTVFEQWLCARSCSRLWHQQCRVSGLLDHTASSGAYFLFKILKLLDTYSRLVLILLLVSMWINKSGDNRQPSVFQPWHYWLFGPENSLLWRAVLVHCRIFSSLPDLCPLDASSIIPVVTIKNISRQCQMPPGRKNLPAFILVENCWPRSSLVDFPTSLRHMLRKIAQPTINHFISQWEVTANHQDGFFWIITHRWWRKEEGKLQYPVHVYILELISY